MPFPRLKIGLDALQRVVRMYPNQKRAAEALGVSYVRFRRVLKRYNLRDTFPAPGGCATWV